MDRVSTGRDADGWSEEEKEKGQWKKLKKQNKANRALMYFKVFKDFVYIKESIEASMEKSEKRRGDSRA